VGVGTVVVVLVVVDGRLDVTAVCADEVVASFSALVVEELSPPVSEQPTVNIDRVMSATPHRKAGLGADRPTDS
jgi:hypothetical protein